MPLAHLSLRVIACALVVAGAAPARAQAPSPAGMTRVTAVEHVAAAPNGGRDSAAMTRGPNAFALRVDARRTAPTPWWAPVASALAPGAGQAALKQDRWVAFAALEGVAWLRFIADREEAHREQRGYRRIANQVARALYTTGKPPAGGFDYYETMEKWIASGVYDAMPGGVLEPETDSTTYNGATWLLARQTYWTRIDEPPLPESDAYRNAIAFYERRAIRPDYRWSWRDAQLQQDLYRRGILRSNAAYRRATQDLAAVLANHVLSTVDSYISVRLRLRGGPLSGETRLEATLPWP